MPKAVWRERPQLDLESLVRHGLLNADGYAVRIHGKIAALHFNNKLVVTLRLDGNRRRLDQMCWLIAVRLPDLQSRLVVTQLDAEAILRQFFCRHVLGC